MSGGGAYATEHSEFSSLPPPVSAECAAGRLQFTAPIKKRKTMGDLNITTRSAGDVTILDLSGSIQLGTSSSQLHQTLKSHVDGGERNIVINLANVTSIDSSGLGSLIAGYATLEKNDGTLKLCNLSTRVIELMTITKLFTVFDIFNSEAEAVASFDIAPETAEQAAKKAANGGTSLL
jgi:anti-sigma B factor antagonist